MVRFIGWPLLIFWMLWLSPSCLASPPRYTVIDLGILPGYDDSFATSINDTGQVTGTVFKDVIIQHAVIYEIGAKKVVDLGFAAGYSCASGEGINNAGDVVGDMNAFKSDVAAQGADFVHHGFLYHHQKVAPLVAAGQYVVASRINNKNQIVGYVRLKNGDNHACLLSRTIFFDLGTLPGGTESFADAVNDLGQVTGRSATSRSSGIAFLYRGGRMQSLGTLPGGETSDGQGINIRGDVTGYGDVETGGYHAFLYHQGKMRDLGTLGGDSQGQAINNQGLIVGKSDVSEDHSHAFLYYQGKMLDLNKLIPLHSGWVLDEALGINNKGQIVGSGTHNGKTRAFVLTPL